MADFSKAMKRTFKLWVEVLIRTIQAPIKKVGLLLVCLLLLQVHLTSASANHSTYNAIEFVVAQDYQGSYSRSAFKHWIDADRDGCDTRSEVLIAEATVKPTVGKKCALTGGKWLSPYDGKFTTKASELDIDHLVPLAEAWRSGAWAWTAKQRQDYANDLGDKRALIAVTLTSNRSKSDNDISVWTPKLDLCGYTRSWIAIKIRYSLTYDAEEAKAITDYSRLCLIGDSRYEKEFTVQALAGYTYQSDRPIPAATQLPTVSPTQLPTVSPTQLPTVSPTQLPTVSPGAFCTPAGATGRSSSSILYTCKTSPTDTRNRWRQ